MAEAVTVLIRLIRSFEYRNVKPLVLQQVDKNQTFEELVATIKHRKCSQIPLNEISY